MRKLYLFTNTDGNGYTGWEHCYSMADDGHVLGSHLCSGVNFMRGDLFEREDRRKTAEKHFKGKEGKEFEVICLDVGKLPPKAVLEKNKKLGEKAKPKEKDITKIEIEMSND